MADEAQQGLKDRDLQDYYESLQATFATKGWSYLLEDLVKLRDAADRLNGIETMEQLNFRRGQVDILNLMIAQSAVISAAYQVLLEDEADA